MLFTGDKGEKPRQLATMQKKERSTIKLPGSFVTIQGNLANFFRDCSNVKYGAFFATTATLPIWGVVT